jgi:hypothetical protein
MSDFLNKYIEDKEFREFIDAISDTSSELWKDYRIVKSFKTLYENEESIKNKEVDISYMLEPIEEMIRYYQEKELYEKCSFLNKIKKYILS